MYDFCLIFLLLIIAWAAYPMMCKFSEELDKIEESCDAFWRDVDKKRSEKNKEG